MTKYPICLFFQALEKVLPQTKAHAEKSKEFSTETAEMTALYDSWVAAHDQLVAAVTFAEINDATSNAEALSQTDQRCDQPLSTQAQTGVFAGPS
jgi:hypothetical protein